jgi:hypothetical protein
MIWREQVPWNEEFSTGGMYTPVPNSYFDVNTGLTGNVCTINSELVETKRVAREKRAPMFAKRRAGDEGADLKTMKRERLEVDFGVHAEGY